MEAELDALMARAGVTVPSDRRADLFAAFLEMRAAVALLYGEGVGQAEPALVLRPRPLGGA